MAVAWLSKATILRLCQAVLNAMHESIGKGTLYSGDQSGIGMERPAMTYALNIGSDTKRR